MPEHTIRSDELRRLANEHLAVCFIEAALEINRLGRLLVEADPRLSSIITTVSAPAARACQELVRWTVE